MPSATGYTPASFSTERPDNQVHVHGVNASVSSSRIIGTILKEVYAKRRVSVKATRDIEDQCSLWERDLQDCLHWQRGKQTALHGDFNSGQASHAHGIAVLHVNLLHYHSIILLTRPFFLFLIQTGRRGSSQVAPRLRARTEMFSKVCVDASYQTIAMCQTAREAMYLPKRNPFVM